MNEPCRDPECPICKGQPLDTMVRVSLEETADPRIKGKIVRVERVDPAPPAMPEDEALAQIARIEQAHWYTEHGTPDWMALQDDLRKIGDVARAALRSRQSPPLLKQASDKLANALSDKDWSEAASASNDLDEYLAAAPQPSPQGEDATPTVDAVDPYESGIYNIGMAADLKTDVTLDWEEAEALRARLASLDAAKDDGEMREGWISVEERLPKFNQEVLAIDILGDRWLGLIEREDGDIKCFSGDDEASNITHWMPLPEPPEARAALERKEEE